MVARYGGTWRVCRLVVTPGGAAPCTGVRLRRDWPLRIGRYACRGGAAAGLCARCGGARRVCGLVGTPARAVRWRGRAPCAGAPGGCAGWSLRLLGRAPCTGVRLRRDWPMRVGRYACRGGPSAGLCALRGGARHRQPAGAGPSGTPTGPPRQGPCTFVRGRPAGVCRPVSPTPRAAGVRWPASAPRRPVSPPQGCGCFAHRAGGRSAADCHGAAPLGLAPQGRCAELPLTPWRRRSGSPEAGPATGAR